MSSNLSNPPVTPDESLLPPLRRSLDVLASPMRRAILFTLAERGELSYGQLARALGLKSSSAALAHHLMELEASPLVANYYEKQRGRKAYSFYALTDTGRRLAAALLKVFPLTPQVPTADAASGQATTEAVPVEV